MNAVAKKQTSPSAGREIAPAGDIALSLAAPFRPEQLGWKPQAVSGNRALAIAYIDARDVMDRLDEVVGVDGWTDEYEMLPDGSALCRLRVRFGTEWILKMDVGGESDQKEQGDRHKAAVSDALKRAAVKFGVGRYLYSQPSQWCDYDPQKRDFVRTPTLPVSARPGGRATGPAGGRPAEPGKVTGPKNGGQRKLPETGEELWQRLRAYDERLAAEDTIQGGELLEYIRGWTEQYQLPQGLDVWTREDIARVMDAAKGFAVQAAQKKAAPFPA